MKSFAAVALLATVAYAQLPDIPSCALNCFVTALTSDGCSSLTDFSCHCQKTQLISSVQPCVEKACSAADQAKVLSTVQDTCAGVGHPISINVPSSVASATPTPSAASSSPAASSSAAESTPSATPSETPSASPSATPSESAASTPVVLPTTASSTPTHSSNGTNIGTPTPSASAFTGAASRPTQVAALMAALGLAAAAL